MLAQASSPIAVDYDCRHTDQRGHWVRCSDIAGEAGIGIGIGEHRGKAAKRRDRREYTNERGEEVEVELVEVSNQPIVAPSSNSCALFIAFGPGVAAFGYPDIQVRSPVTGILPRL